MKHKYAEQIHAFADGAEIQCRKRVRCGNPPPWEDITKPSWLDDFEYRVKPTIDEVMVHNVMAQNRELLEKVGRLRTSNGDLHDENHNQALEIGRLNTLIKCLDNSNTVLTTESRVYRQVEKDLQARIDALVDGHDELEQRNKALRWAHDTAVAVGERRRQEIEELHRRIEILEQDNCSLRDECRDAIADPPPADADADIDAQAFGADVVISIQFPPAKL
jgi:cell division protein FtsB